MTEDHLGEFFSPMHTTRRLWVTRTIGTRVMAMNRVELMFGFFLRAKFVCPNHLLHFGVHFLLGVAKLCFFFSFSLRQPLGHRSRLDLRYGQGEGYANPMWTWMGKEMNGAKMSGRE